MSEYPGSEYSGAPVLISGNEVLLAEPAIVPDHPFVGREAELRICRVAWGTSPDGTKLADNGLQPLSFRLEGAPGMGKNEIVYQIARTLNKPLFIIQGHEELTPEDLALLLTPTPGADYGTIPLQLRASPLATAIHVGGLFFFDEINRVPERALSPLASVLDGRQYIYSAMTGTNIGPRDDEARRGFRFCCALNPALSNAGYVLPEYIEQRTLPAIEVQAPPPSDLRRIIETTLKPSRELLDEFEAWYAREENHEMSVRQAVTVVNYVMSLMHQVGDPNPGVFDKVPRSLFGRRR
ncbi:MAG: AAA domain-containing protein [Catenulispora sp.]|nr:AAA domain-containing protein [Catenulispora sp.]